MAKMRLPIGNLSHCIDKTCPCHDGYLVRECNICWVEIAPEPPEIIWNGHHDNTIWSDK